jgi:hypothetical protein
MLGPSSWACSSVTRRFLSRSRYGLPSGTASAPVRLRVRWARMGSDGGRVAKSIHVPTLPDFDRAQRIGEFWDTPRPGSSVSC